LLASLLLTGLAHAGEPVARKLTINEAVAQTRAELKGRDISDILGVTHTTGLYSFTDQPFLLEGAGALRTMGCKVIKLWFTPGYVKSYPWHSTWPTNITSLADLAQSPYFAQVFDMPFHT
jgi:hypothetical protein